jgi:putative pyruvate formate lyase activating enzyme
VTPTHYVPQILKALSLAASRGLTIPLVYNCGGYESLEVIRLLDGIVDIYMPDIKFLDSHLSGRYCKADDYPQVVKEVVKEMQKQVGDLTMDAQGVAVRGLLIRHLIMPSCEEDSRDVLRFIRDEVSADAYVNVMAQYHPCHRASLYPEIDSRPSLQAHREVIDFGRCIGLSRAGAH